MHIALLSLSFHLPGCASLKEKRGRLRGLKDRFGKIANLAVSEAGNHDKHQSSQWLFVALAQEKSHVDQLFAQVETFANSELDAIITQVQREWL